MHQIKDWPINSPNWTNDPEAMALLLSLGQGCDVATGNDGKQVDLKHIAEKSENFAIKFPIETVRIKTLQNVVDRNILNRNINSTYPIVHEYALWLFAKFILHKRKFGNAKEKVLYEKMTLSDLINRLLFKRAASFIGKYDLCMLLDGSRHRNQWDSIGTDKETTVLNLNNLISYDEIKLSALLSVSSYTYFINDGDRHNKGNAVNDRSNIEDEGIIIGLIGARMKREKRMEHEEIAVTKTQNTRANGYGNSDTEKSNIHNFFADFYEISPILYDEVNERTKVESNRFTKLKNDVIFDNEAFAKRIALSIDTLLLESNCRASSVGKFAFVHVVGLGLGVWRMSENQNEIFVEMFISRLRVLGAKLSSVSDVFFSYIPLKNNRCSLKHGDTFKIENHPKSGIKIHFGKRNPHAKLFSPDKLLVASYAWDGNALPGNEFWNGSLSSSGDPAAACSTQIAELHNPYINPKVSADEIKIATLTEGVMSFNEYKNYISTKRK